MAAHLLTLIVMCALVYAAWHDLRTRLIPNVVPIIILATVVAALVTLPAFRADWVDRAAALGVMLVVGTALGAVRAMGGGDIKLLAALAPWHGLNDLPVALLLIGVAGGLIALAFVLRSAIAGQGLRNGLRTKVLYWLAILVGEGGFITLNFNIV
jgi:prepilin peptidase CpaA